MVVECVLDHHCFMDTTSTTFVLTPCCVPLKLLCWVVTNKKAQLVNNQDAIRCSNIVRERIKAVDFVLQGCSLILCWRLADAKHVNWGTFNGGLEVEWLIIPFWLYKTQQDRRLHAPWPSLLQGPVVLHDHARARVRVRWRVLNHSCSLFSPSEGFSFNCNILSCMSSADIMLTSLSVCRRMNLSCLAKSFFLSSSSGNVRPVTVISFSSLPLVTLYWDIVNGAQGTQRDSSPSSTIFLQLSFTAPAVGGAGAQISPPCSLLFHMRCLVPGVRPSSLKVSILELSANCFNTCPQFAPGMSCSLANFCRLAEELVDSAWGHGVLLPCPRGLCQNLESGIFCFAFV